MNDKEALLAGPASFVGSLAGNLTASAVKGAAKLGGKGLVKGVKAGYKGAKGLKGRLSGGGVETIGRISHPGGEMSLVKGPKGYQMRWEEDGEISDFNPEWDTKEIVQAYGMLDDKGRQEFERQYPGSRQSYEDGQKWELEEYGEYMDPDYVKELQGEISKEAFHQAYLEKTADGISPAAYVALLGGGGAALGGLRSAADPEEGEGRGRSALRGLIHGGTTGLGASAGGILGNDMGRGGRIAGVLGGALGGHLLGDYLSNKLVPYEPEFESIEDLMAFLESRQEGDPKFDQEQGSE